MKKTVLALISFLFVAVAFSQVNTATIQKYLDAHQEELELSDNVLKNWGIYDQHYDERANLNYVYIRQEIDGIEIYNAGATFAVREQSVVLSGNNLLKNLSGNIAGSKPSVSAKDALFNLLDLLQIDRPTSLQRLESETRSFAFAKGEWHLKIY